MIRLHVIGIPAPQGSKTRVGGHMIEGSSKTGRAKLAEWRRAVADAARAWLDRGGERATGPVALTVNFTFPHTASDPHRYLHQSKPDVDKVLRATLDALVSSTLLADDAKVCRAYVTKTYGDEPGAVLAISDLTDEEADKRAESKQRALERRKAQKAALLTAADGRGS